MSAVKGETLDAIVPIEPLRELILEYAANEIENAQFRTTGNGTNWKQWDESWWVQSLADLSGISTRTIRGIVSGRLSWTAGHVSFAMADQLVCTMGCVQEWHEGGRLHEFYGPLKVRTYELQSGFELPDGFKLSYGQEQRYRAGLKQQAVAA